MNNDSNAKCLLELGLRTQRFTPRASIILYVVVLLFYLGTARADQPVSGATINPLTGLPVAPSAAPRPFNPNPPDMRHLKLTWDAITNFPVTDALLESNSIPANDIAGKLFLSEIEWTKHQLQDTNTPPIMRPFLEKNLEHIHANLNKHLNDVKFWRDEEAHNRKLWADAAAKLRANRKLPPTERESPMEIIPDPLVMGLSGKKALFQRNADDTNLPLIVRQANEQIVSNLQSEIEDHEGDARVWANLYDARISGNQTRMADALQAAVNHYAVKASDTSLSLSNRLILEQVVSNLQSQIQDPGKDSGQ